MYDNRMVINTTAQANGGSAFTNGLYWSSTEIGNISAWRQSFLDSNQFGNLKSNGNNRVRAVRGF